jgi:hypothetical protein
LPGKAQPGNARCQGRSPRAGAYRYAELGGTQSEERHRLPWTAGGVAPDRDAERHPDVEDVSHMTGRRTHGRIGRPRIESRTIAGDPDQRGQADWGRGEGAVEPQLAAAPVAAQRQPVVAGAVGLGSASFAPVPATGRLGDVRRA